VTSAEKIKKVDVWTVKRHHTWIDNTWFTKGLSEVFGNRSGSHLYRDLLKNVFLMNQLIFSLVSYKSQGSMKLSPRDQMSPGFLFWYNKVSNAKKAET
jgi:hypothetical protein